MLRLHVVINDNNTSRSLDASPKLYINIYIRL